MKTMSVSQFLLLFLLSISCVAAAQAQTKKKGLVVPAPSAPAPAAPLPAPEAPALPMPEAVPAPAASSAYPENAAGVITSLNGIYQGPCVPVANSVSELSSARYTTVSDEGAKIQITNAFYLSTNCTGSVYARYQHIARATYIVARSNGQFSNGAPVAVWKLQQAQYQAPVLGFGAVMLPRTDRDLISVILTGQVVATHPGVESMPVENLLIGSVPDGIFLVSNLTSGVAFDAQGFPAGFGQGTFLSKRR